MAREQNESGGRHPYWDEQSEAATRPRSSSGDSSGREDESNATSSSSREGASRTASEHEGEPRESSAGQASGPQGSSGNAPRESSQATNSRGGDGTSSDGGGQTSWPPPRTRPRLSGARAALLAKGHLLELTGREPESVSGVNRHETGWRIHIEVVESARVPSTADLLGSYRVDLDQDGELTECNRTHRYFRSQAGQH